MRKKMIYLDHAATTPVRPEVRAAMEPFLWDRFGNASSVHAAGRAARGALEDARERIASALGAARSEVVFTGGGTEADNLAVLGRWRATGGGVAVSAVEHSAVLEAASQAAREGAALSILGVDAQGLVDPGAVEEALTSSLAVLSVMWANNEVGTVQPVDRIAELCRARGVAFHTDAVQAIGHVPVDVARIGCDLLALSAHKFGGPQGVGVLYVRRGTELVPLAYGGGQEGGLRAGTANVAGAVGLATALELAMAETESESARLSELRDELERALLTRVPGVRINGSTDARLPHVLSISVEEADPDVLLASLDLAGLAVSSGSACHTGAAAPSHVLVAMGAATDAVVRFSLGWTTEASDIAAATAIFADVVERARGAGVRA
jgi:cysteine desulfurase